MSDQCVDAITASLPPSQEPVAKSVRTIETIVPIYKFFDSGLISLHDNSFAPVLLENSHTGMVYLLQRSAPHGRLLQLGKRPGCCSGAFPPPVNDVKGFDSWRRVPLDRSWARRRIWSKLLIRLAESIHYRFGSGLFVTLKSNCAKGCHRVQDLGFRAIDKL
jgi:hypothetical protein